MSFSKIRYVCCLYVLCSCQIRATLRYNQMCPVNAELKVIDFKDYTLVRQIFRQPKKYPLLIQRSRPSRDSQEPKTKIIFQFSRGLFQKIPFLYFFLHKSWIWRTLGRVTKKISYCHFHNASKESFWSKNFSNFMRWFKSAILEKLPNCQNGTFEPVHKI